ncbi:MAG: 2-oxo acid dehydrogenase subunit E2, partial [Vulcanococcus sp.]
NQMQVNLTCDHRVIYGAHAAAFLKDLANLIETSPDTLAV